MRFDRLGTAMVYPSLIAAVSDASHPTWRARSLSVYRFWRDLGYAIGALSAGLIADSYGLSSAITSIAALTFLSGTVVAILMRNQKGAVDEPVTHSTDRSDATGGGQPLDNTV